MPAISGLDVGAGAAGGVLVAVSASSLLLLGGQLTGLSGFTNTFFLKEGRHHPISWRGIYITAMAGTGLLVSLLGYGPKAFGEVTLQPWAIALAGGLVGFSTRLANGCTSGHGLCGLPRLSLRSALATGSFMATGMVTASVIRNIPAVKEALFRATPLTLNDLLPSALAKGLGSSNVTGAAVLAMGAILAVPVARGLLNLWDRVGDSFSKGASKKQEETSKSSHHHHHHHHAHSMHLPRPGAAILAAAGGAVFGLGLTVSGMTNPAVVQAFLDPFGTSFSGGWNPTLAFVMGAGVLINFLAFKYASQSRAAPPFELEHHHQHPAAGGASQAAAAPVKPLKDHITMGKAPANLKIDRNLLVGSALFGVGWGLGGICPGPGLVSFGGGAPAALIFVPSMLAGMLILSVLQHHGVIAGGATTTAVPSKDCATCPVAPTVATPAAIAAASTPVTDKEPLLEEIKKQASGGVTADASPISTADGDDSESDDEDG